MALTFATFLMAAAAEADGGCGATVTHTFSICSHCGNPVGDILGGFLMALILFPFFLGFKRLLFGKDELVLLRLNEEERASAQSPISAAMNSFTSGPPSRRSVSGPNAGNSA